MKNRLAYLCILLSIIGCQNDVGLNSLISLSTENPGVNCETGGTRIDAGIDKNSNEVLDSNEITATNYVCNAIDGKTSLVNVIDETPGANCVYGGVKITSGIDTNGNGTLDASEIQITRYVCDGEGGIVSEEIQINMGTGATSVSSNPVIVSGPTTFDIRNYPNVDSVVFVADPYVVNSTNFALVELYNATDGQVISNSLLRSNDLYEEREQLKTNNLFEHLPKKRITLGIKFSSETDGQFAGSGSVYLFLYRTK
ncbi:MAG TPA: hypothetical protein VK589_07195 [Chryseolinea sp.]|nr:hypothetical protein [Chryseolinea sp.]